MIEIDYMTDGQATTCMLAIPYCNQDNEIMVYNIDTYVESNEMKYEDICGDGHIPCFHADGDHWSFAKLNDRNEVIEVREKFAFLIIVLLVRIISHRQSCIKLYMKSIMQTPLIWRRMKI